VLIFNLAAVSIGSGIAFNEYFGPSSYPGASPAVGTLVAGLGMVAVCATYYFWTVTLPRSGGTYVFLSRTLSPGFAFVLSLLETVEAAWAGALGATLVVTMGVSPLLATVGAVAENGTLLDAATATASPTGIFLIGAAVQVLAAVVMTAGMRRHFSIQKVLFAIAMAGIVVLGLVLAFGSRVTFAANLSTIGGLDYNEVISAAEAQGYVHQGFSLGPSLLFVVFGALTLIAAANSISIGGEVRRVQRSQLWGMFGAVAVATLVIAAFDPLTRHAFGDRFVGAIAYNSLNGVTGGSTEDTIGATPYLPVLAGILGGNIALAVIHLPLPPGGDIRHLAGGPATRARAARHHRGRVRRRGFLRDRRVHAVERPGRGRPTHQEPATAGVLDHHGRRRPRRALVRRSEGLPAASRHRHPARVPADPHRVGAARFRQANRRLIGPDSLIDLPMCDRLSAYSVSTGQGGSATPQG